MLIKVEPLFESWASGGSYTWARVRLTCSCGWSGNGARVGTSEAFLLARCSRCGDKLAPEREPEKFAALVTAGAFDAATALLTADRRRLEALRDHLVAAQCPACGHALSPAEQMDAARAILRIVDGPPEEPDPNNPFAALSAL